MIKKGQRIKFIKFDEDKDRANKERGHGMVIGDVYLSAGYKSDEYITIQSRENFLFNTWQFEVIDEAEKKLQFKVGDRVEYTYWSSDGKGEIIHICADKPASQYLVKRDEVSIARDSAWARSCKHIEEDKRNLWLSSENLKLITPTITRYTGELREGMRVWIINLETGAYTLIKEGVDFAFRFKPGVIKIVSQQGDWWGWKHDEFEYYISHVISEPEEKECGDKWDPSEGDTTGFNFVPYPLNTIEPMRYWALQDAVRSIKNSPKQGLKTIMSNTLKKATNLIHSQAEPLKSYLRLGWVEIKDTEFEVTDAGVEAMTRLFFGFGEGKSLGEYAQNEVKRLEKEEKKAKR